MPQKTRILIFIVSYNAEKLIASVLDRIPKQLMDRDDIELEVLVIDDQSKDLTFKVADEYRHKNPHISLKVFYNPKNQGYGGNQKLGYTYAVKNGFDIVVLLHGDGQYAPELLADMIDPIATDNADVVLGSRMLNRLDALRGGMPFYKWIGNQILTGFQNRLLGTKIAEFHTGYRAYRVKSLAAVPFMFASDDFDFDTDILIQMIDTKQRFKEISIPTYYGDEICHVNGLKYAFQVFRTSIQSRLIRLGIYYDPKYDYDFSNQHYNLKLGYDSSHEFALQRVQDAGSVLDIGCGPGNMTVELKKHNLKITALDREINSRVKELADFVVEAEVDNFDFSKSSDVDLILALDIIEHVRHPEVFLKNIRGRFAKTSPRIIITTGNVAFILVRLSLLFGQFNYGKRGILDHDHTRLFTFKSLLRALSATGYNTIEVRGIPVPFPEAFGHNLFSTFLLSVNRLLIKVSKSMFSYQIGIVAVPRPTLDNLIEDAIYTGEKMREQLDWQ